MENRIPPAPPYKPLPVSLLVLVFTLAAIEIVLSMADRGIFFEPSLRPRIFVVGAFWNELLRGTTPIFGVQPWTMFLTHAILHGGFLHMAMNLAVLAGLARFASDRYGARMILPVFVVGAVAGGAAFGALSDSAIPMVGASGAVFAFLGVWIVADWARLRSRGAPVRPIVTRVLTLAALNVAFYFALAGMLAWEAHLGGFLAGVACGLWLEGRRTARVLEQARQRRMNS